MVYLSRYMGYTYMLYVSDVDCAKVQQIGRMTK